eukprot:TRINITY_DN4983_c0_g1_i1.p1 TRINITY_DN4983_c0_g1~~TRINITY_DN4983_c0_g1_i1.p1  ORF type:complete len:386 (-),score=136.37 TRINITY_DN4983_c0_g1_i1:20-1177(-)
MKQMVEYIQNYMKSSESNTEQLEREHEKEIEALEASQKKLQETVIELEDENASYEKQFEEAVQEYEDKITFLKLERKMKNQENIDNLSTLVNELTNIEETNATLTEELEVEKLNSLKIAEELELSKRIILQMEVKIANQSKELAKQSNQGASQSATADQSDVVKHLMRKLEKIGEMADELKNMAVPDSNKISSGTVPISVLEEERLAHKETKKALKILKGQSTTKNIHKLQNQANNLLEKSTKEPLSPTFARRTLVSTRFTRVITDNLNKSIEEEEKAKTKENPRLSLKKRNTSEVAKEASNQPSESAPPSKTLPLPNLNEEKDPKLPIPSGHITTHAGQNILVEVLKNTPPRERKPSFSKSFLDFSGKFSKKDKGKRMGIIAYE